MPNAFACRKKRHSEGKSICCNIFAWNYVYCFKIYKASTLSGGHFVISMKKRDRLPHCFSDMKDDCLKSRWFPFNSQPSVWAYSGFNPHATTEMSAAQGSPQLSLSPSPQSKHTQPPPSLTHFLPEKRADIYRALLSWALCQCPHGVPLHVFLCLYPELMQNSIRCVHIISFSQENYSVR